MTCYRSGNTVELWEQTKVALKNQPENNLVWLEGNQETGYQMTHILKPADDRKKT